jgi:D-tyrosyl-tRNA(Tyr) deacylase
MIGVIQRVSEAAVLVDNRCISEIKNGLLVLVGISKDDDQGDIDYLVNKTVHLRIFSDEQGNLNKSLIDVKGELLIVSQFTLLGDTRKGRRPSFSRAAPPDMAEQLYRLIVEKFRDRHINVKEGVFRAMMEVKLINQGPVTLIIDSREKNRKIVWK